MDCEIALPLRLRISAVLCREAPMPDLTPEEKLARIREIACADVMARLRACERERERLAAELEALKRRWQALKECFEEQPRPTSPCS